MFLWNVFLTGLSPCKCGQKGTNPTEKAPRVLQFHRTILRYSSPGDAPRHIQTSKWENVSSPSSYLFIRILHIKTSFLILSIIYGFFVKLLSQIFNESSFCYALFFFFCCQISCEAFNVSIRKNIF